MIICMSHSPNIQQTGTTEPDIEGGRTHAHIHNLRSMFMTLLATHQTSWLSQNDMEEWNLWLPSPMLRGRIMLPIMKGFAIFCFWFSFTCLNHNCRIPGFLFCFLLFFLYNYCQETTNNITLWKSVVTCYPGALRAELASIYVRISFFSFTRKSLQKALTTMSVNSLDKSSWLKLFQG